MEVFGAPINEVIVGAVAVVLAALAIIIGAILEQRSRKRSDQERFEQATDDNYAIYMEARRRIHEEGGQPWRSSLD